VKIHYLQSERDYLAPDGSEIRQLLDLDCRKGGLTHSIDPRERE
jgi:hypothetical protein